MKKGLIVPLVTAMVFLMSTAAVPAMAMSWAPKSQHGYTGSWACNNGWHPSPATVSPKYDLTGTWAINFILSGDGSYPHTMMISSFDPCTGVFSGVGYYAVDPAYTWTVTGTESGNTVNFQIIYTGINAGYTVEAVGTLTSCTSMTGTATSSTGQSFTWTGAKGTEVLNVCYNVVNDEDSGFVGYWALDNYAKTVQVWQDPNNPTNFYAIATYCGTWQTFKGALSPENGVTEGADAIGPFQGGYFASFTYTGTVTPAWGYIGFHDFGGTKADILLGTYGNGQTGATNVFDVYAKYFPSYSNWYYFNWGWTYTYGKQTWVNAATGSYGDIVVPAWAPCA